MQRRDSWIRLVYALCLAGATINHVRAVLTYGWLRHDVPLATAVYWSSLTVLDPVAALLLFIRPRVGVALTVAIILSDAAHNLWFRATHPLSASFIEDVTSSFFMMSQVAFLMFVAFTAPMAWTRTKDPVPVPNA